MRNNAFVLIMGMFSLYTPSRHKVQVSGSLKPRPLYPRGKSRRYPLNSRLGGSRLDVLEDTNPLPLLDIEPRIVQPVAESQHRLGKFNCL